MRLNTLINLSEANALKKNSAELAQTKKPTPIILRQKSAPQKLATVICQEKM